MRQKIEFAMFLSVLVSVLYFFTAPSFAAPAPVRDPSGAGADGSQGALSADGVEKRAVAMAAPPRYTEAAFTSLDGEILVNPQYTGKVTSVRTIDKNGLLGDRIDVEVRVMTDGWRKFSLPPSLSSSWGVIISGEEGILKISKPEAGIAGAAGELKSISGDVIEFGSLNTTFVFPAVNVLEPSTYEIGVLNTADNSFINSNIIAMKSDQAAVEFERLPPSVVNKEGLMRVSLKKPGGTFVNSSIPAWGYDIMVPEIDIDTPAPITAEVFGLPDEARIRFDFTSLSGQVIDPSTRIMTVGEINKGSTVSTITTKFGGAQPLTVLVKRVE